MTALSTVRTILFSLVAKPREKDNIHVRLDWFDSSFVVSLVEALSFPQNTSREEKTMIDLLQTNEKLNKLTNKRDDQ